MKLPFDLLAINSWKAFKGGKSDVSLGHRIILITKRDEFSFHFLMVTSKIDKAKNRCRKDKASLLEISPDDWDDLSLPSCIECGKSDLKKNIISLVQLKEMYDNDNLIVLGDVPDVVKTGIKNAICFSKTYTDAEKRIYTQD